MHEPLHGSPRECPREPAPLWRDIAVAVCIVGVALRLGLWLAAGEPELHQDEASYVYLALGWSRFGFLGDGERYLWPPLWPFTLRQAFELFGRDALWAAKLLLVLASSSVGASVVGLGARLGGRRAAWGAGLAWALYLPLAAFTHLLWAEPLFLSFLAPALYLIVHSEQVDPERATRSLFAAGLLLGLASLTKELGLVLALGLALGLAATRRGDLREGLRRASLLLLCTAAVLAPWTARNQSLYGAFVPAGASLGANAFNGLNAHSMPFDLLPVARARGELQRLARMRRPLLRPSEDDRPWPTAREVKNTVERSREDLRRGLAWARAHPVDFFRTRLARLADFVLPTSYYVRHQALDRYAQAPLGARWVRRSTVLLAVLSVVLLLLLIGPGLWALAHGEARGGWVLVVTLLVVGASALLVSNSRFRIPLLPAAFVLVGLALAEPHQLLRERRARWVLALWLGALGFLGWLDARELSYVLESSL